MPTTRWVSGVPRVDPSKGASKERTPAQGPQADLRQPHQGHAHHGYPYETVSHPWARQFWRPGFDGAAHDPSHGQISYALFGRSDQPAGYGSFATGPIPAPLLEQAQAVYGFRIV